jgi:hypothetical protein
MNSRKVYNICLIQLIMLDIFVFMTLTLEVVLKVIWAEMLFFVAYSYVIMVNNLKTVMNLRKVYIT